MRKSIVFVFVTIGMIVGIVSGANYGLFKTLDHVIGVDAERKALDWAAFSAIQIPDIDQLLETGAPTLPQAARIRDVAHHGDVFRFKLFDSLGRNVLVSDALSQFLLPDVVDVRSDTALGVLASGNANVSLNDGREKENRPDLYAEAYVPIRGVRGQVIGVAEVYLDQSAIWHAARDVFFTLSVVLSIVFTSAMLLFYAGFLWKRKQAGTSRRQADYLAKYDQLSNLHNRGGFNEKVEAMRKSGQISPAQTAIIYLDVDHFKHINDTYGHHAGDAFLRHVGQSISDCLGPDDLAGRLGGDEFVIVAQMPNVESACAWVENLQALVSQPVRFDGTTILGTISLGLQYCGEDNCVLEENLHRADLALYQAKMDGRNLYRVFTPDMEVKVARRRKVETAVLAGLSEELFEVHFQPLLHQKTKQCVGFEALLRLTNIDGESISPEEFIPVAESIGAIKPLGAWVLKQSAAAAVAWPDHLFVSVNLSARQFEGGDLVDLVKQVTAETGLSAKRLELEVTESLLIANAESVGAQLAALSALGVSIAMDDFGTGYSSLGYLWKFGFDKLKIDRSFILGLGENDSRAKEILDTIIVLGHRLNMVVTAEGIETEAQAEVLAALDCDQFQGYLYGKAMPVSDIAAFMLKNISAGNGDMPMDADKFRALR